MEQLTENRTLSARKGEEAKPHFRSERIMVMNGAYYFLTRENTQEGPFETRWQAERELNLFVKDMMKANEANTASLAISR